MPFIKRITSIIATRLPFRSSSEPTGASESAITEHLRTRYWNETTPPHSINVVLFGEAGVGKSSVVNLIAQRKVAKVSSDVEGCTMESTKYNIELDGERFAIFDTVGLEQPRMDENGYLKAIEKLYELITALNYAGGVHLLLFCMRGGKISATTQSNYRLFSETLRIPGVPIAIVFTGLEREVEMEDWWRRNQRHIEGYGIKSDGHACVTTVLDNDTPGEDLKYNESRVVIRDLLKTCALRNTSRSPDTLAWFARCARDMDAFIAQNKIPKRKKVLKVLVERCKLDPDTAKKIADMMEKGEPNTRPAQSGTIGELNPPDLGLLDPVPEGEDTGDEVSDDDEEGYLDHRTLESRVVTVSPSSDVSLPKTTTEAGQQAQGRSKEDSRSSAESIVSRRRETTHAKKYMITSKPVDADKAGTFVPHRETAKKPQNSDNMTRTTSFVEKSSKRSGEAYIPISATRTISSRGVREDRRLSNEDSGPYAIGATPSCSIREGIKRSKEAVIPGGTSRAIPYTNVRESIRLTKGELVQEGTRRAFASPSISEGIRPKEVFIPDSAGSATSSPSVRESTRLAKEELDGAGRALPSRSVKESIRTKEVLAPDSAGRAARSANVKEGIRPSRKEHYADTILGSMPCSIGETQATVRSSKRSREESIPSSATGTMFSRSVREDTKPLREDRSRNATSDFSSSTVREGIKQSNGEDIPDGASRPIPYPEVRESIRPTKEELALEGPSRTFLSPSIKANISPKEALIPGSAGRATSSRNDRESTRPTKEEPILDGAGRALPSSGVREGIRAKEVLAPDGAGSAASSPGVRESVRPTREELVLDGISRATSSLNVKEGTRSSRKELYADTASSPTPYSAGETRAAMQPKSVASSSAGADRRPAVSGTGRGPSKTKTVPNLDSSWSAAGPREVSGQFERGSNLEVVSQAGVRVGAGGSTGQLRNAGTNSVSQPLRTVVAAQTYAGRGDSTARGQSSSRR